MFRKIFNSTLKETFYTVGILYSTFTANHYSDKVIHNIFAQLENFKKNQAPKIEPENNSGPKMK